MLHMTGFTDVVETKILDIESAALCMWDCFR